MRANLGVFSRTVVVCALSLSGLALAPFVLASAAGGAWDNVSRALPSTTPVSPLSSVNVLGWGFDEPWAITTGGAHIWVANNGNSVTELSASTGALAAPVNPNEADSSRVHCGVATTSSSGSLIQTAWGGAGGVGTLRTKRSGCAA